MKSSPAASNLRVMDAVAPRVARDRNVTAVAVLLASVSFLLSGVLAWRLYDLRALLQSDPWFQADAHVLLNELRTDSLLRHPNFQLFVIVPARLVALLFDPAVRSGVIAWLLVMLVPCAAAIRTTFAFAAMRRLVTDLRLATLLTVLDIVSFQALVIGGAPDSYPISGALIAGMYWLSTREDWGERRSRVLWLMIGVVAVGITVTNLMPLAILATFAARRLGMRLGAAVVAATRQGLMVLGINAVLYAASPAWTGVPLQSLLQAEETTIWTHWPSLSVVREIGWSMAHTFMAPSPMDEPNPTLNPDYSQQFSFAPPYEHRVASWWRAGLTIVAVGAGLFGYAASGSLRMAAPALVILASNFGLHLFFGNHYVLYGQHWQFSLIWLVAGLAFLSPHRGRLLPTLTFTSLAGVTAISNAVLVRELLNRLAVS